MSDTLDPGSALSSRLARPLSALTRAITAAGEIDDLLEPLGIALRECARATTVVLARLPRLAEPFRCRLTTADGSKPRNADTGWVDLCRRVASGDTPVPGGTRAAVTLTSGGRVVGVLAIETGGAPLPDTSTRTLLEVLAPVAAEALAALPAAGAEKTLQACVRGVVAGELDAPSVCRLAVHAVAELGYGRVSIWELAGGALEYRDHVGTPDPPSRVPVGEGILGRVAATGRSAVGPDPASDREGTSTPPDTAWTICIPLAARDRLWGALRVDAPRPAPPAEEEMGVLTRLAAILATAFSAARQCTPAPAPSKPPVRVLVVEDSPVNQKLVGLYLERMGHTADIVTTGEEAVHAGLVGAYDVILMDVRMPGIDGLEATRRLRAGLGPSGSPWIIAVTADADGEAGRDCLAAGMNAVLRKPFLLGDLEQVIRQGIQTLAAPAPTLPGPVVVEELESLCRRIGENGRHGVVQLVETYLESTRETGERILRRAQAGDAQGLAGEVHTLKSASAAVGAHRLSEACARLETTLRGAERPDWPACLVEVGSIRREMDAVRAALAVWARGGSPT